MQKITPFLWFNDQAEEAAHYYCGIFDNAQMGRVSRYGKSGPGKEGSAFTASFILEGVEFTALNGGPHFQFTEAVSFVVHCESQEEIDRYWNQLTADGGKESQCGWLKDKFGLSWQIIPTALPRLLQDADPEKAGRVMKAMMPMKKIDLAVLQHAYEGR
ncbi:MAG TPA: VOC family protein [Flavisolibacter sp.]|jgi:predicted 3-demethylubiquinone-9 3-methyltransferase (glyoxalase superfamily)|nr:VOC family protein [Flavisolibacter sp.]